MILPSFLQRKSRAEQFDIHLGASRVPVTLRRRRALKNMTLRLDRHGNVIVTAPPRCARKTLLSFLGKHSAWLQAQLDRRRAARPVQPGDEIPLRGQPCRVTHSEGRGGARHDETAWQICGPRAHWHRRLRDALKKEALRDLNAAVDHYAERLGTRVAKVSVREMHARWGSCNARGHIAFCWRLILAPPFVLDYVAAHEVAHRLEMNHGPRFWVLVREACPDTDRAKHWLKTEGSTIMALEFGN